MAVPTIETDRLDLRAWTPADRAPFAALNADPEVIRWIGPGLPMRAADSDVLVDRVEEHWAAKGFGLWAVEERATGSFIGFAGLAVPWFLPEVLPAVEVGWRLARSAWGKGYATEAGAAALRYAFERLELAEVIATIFPGNDRSVRVAEKLGLRFTGMRRHPSVGREIAIYRISPGGSAPGAAAPSAR